MYKTYKSIKSHLFFKRHKLTSEFYILYSQERSHCKAKVYRRDLPVISRTM